MISVSGDRLVSDQNEKMRSIAAVTQVRPVSLTHPRAA